MKPLREAGKGACVLVQLPGFLRFDSGRLEFFLFLLPDDQSFAVEFRHSSWLRDEMIRLLADQEILTAPVELPNLGLLI
jgi:uncharacterized protein YecE (DUF72 family)